MRNKKAVRCVVVLMVLLFTFAANWQYSPGKMKPTALPDSDKLVDKITLHLKFDTEKEL